MAGGEGNLQEFGLWDIIWRNLLVPDPDIVAGLGLEDIFEVDVFGDEFDHTDIFQGEYSGLTLSEAIVCVCIILIFVPFFLGLISSNNAS